VRRALYLILALVAIAVGWRFVVAGSRRAETKSGVPTGEVTRGSLVVTLPINGALESAQETPVRTELEGNLIEICEDNSAVKPGDVVYKLDTKTLTDQRDELERALTDAKEALSTTEADSQTRLTQAESDAEAAQESLTLAKEKAQAER
jgi:multidrug efflux pump subunit AcrA (membrane-fusion protein)